MKTKVNLFYTFNFEGFTTFEKSLHYIESSPQNCRDKRLFKFLNKKIKRNRKVVSSKLLESPRKCISRKTIRSSARELIAVVEICFIEPTQEQLFAKLMPWIWGRYCIQMHVKYSKQYELQKWTKIVGAHYITKKNV